MNRDTMSETDQKLNTPVTPEEKPTTTTPAATTPANEDQQASSAKSLLEIAKRNGIGVFRRLKP